MFFSAVMIDRMRVLKPEEDLTLASKTKMVTSQGIQMSSGNEE